MAKFPKEIFVAREVENSGESYLVAEDKIQSHADMREKKYVGIYHLQSIVTVEGITSVKPAKGKG